MKAHPCHVKKIITNRNTNYCAARNAFCYIIVNVSDRGLYPQYNIVTYAWFYNREAYSMALRSEAGTAIPQL